MNWTRRETLVGGAALILLQGCNLRMEELGNQQDLFGLIGQMKAAPGKRSELVRILSEGIRDMPGNLSYMVTEDRSDPDSIWIVEVWKDAESHRASLALPQVRAAIAKGRPLIAGFGTRAEVRPVGGIG